MTSPIPRFETIRQQVESLEPVIASARRMLSEANPKRMTTKQVGALLIDAEKAVAALYAANREVVTWIDDAILAAVMCTVEKVPCEGAVAQLRDILNQSLDGPNPDSTIS